MAGAAGQIVASTTATSSSVTLPQNWPESVFTEGVVLMPHWGKQRVTAMFSVAVPVLSYGNVQNGAMVAVLDLRTAQPYESPLGDVLWQD